jgi:hypothetical protein
VLRQGPYQSHIVGCSNEHNSEIWLATATSHLRTPAFGTHGMKRGQTLLDEICGTGTTSRG